MESKRLYHILIILFIIRVAISLAVNDGKLRSDSLNYFGLSVNIIEHFTFTAMVPTDESVFTGGVTVQEFWNHFEHHPSPYRRLMNYQWLHSLVFVPFIVVFKSLHAIIIVNNLLFLGAGLFLFEIVRTKIHNINLLMGWGLYLFFPPFFYLTNQFYSEPLFIFFLAIIINRIVLQKTPTPFFVIVLILLSITRGLGLFFTAGCILAALFSKEYKSAAIYTVCGISAMFLNFIVGANNRDPNLITVNSPPPVAHSVYFSNTTNGNGDNDYYLAFPEKQEQDKFFSEYLNGQHSPKDLLGEIFSQNFNHPQIFLINTWNKLSAYFLNVIPDSWNYEIKPNQSLLKKTLWSIQNLLLIGLLWFGLKRCDNRFRKFFSLLFWISFASHFVALSRYRYFQPVLIIGFPAITLAISFLSERFNIFRKDALSR